MRVDIVSIFPDYLAPLELSLIGKARRDGLLDVRTWDLRDFTHDRHRTVDDSPYGGGAGMVMSPVPWGEALDAVVAAPRAPIPAREGPTLVVPSPSGMPFTQAVAEDLARRPWLVFACGRYEGIDERVYDYAGDAFPGGVAALSLGDYVLNGGEVAVLAMVEAIARLVPGVIGNQASLEEESHTGGLLEYPVYTKPASWRGYDVPQVLLSGDHGAIAAWRDAQRRQRTAQRRPDLLPAVALAGADDDTLVLRPARPADAAEILVLQRCSWLPEGLNTPQVQVPALVETLEDVREWLGSWRTWVVRDVISSRLVAGVRARAVGTDWEIGRLMVAPDLQGRGIGRRLLGYAESQAPPEAARCYLETGLESTRNQRLYRKAGYRRTEDGRGNPHTMAFAKRAHE
jgi:tRNA (guanine37-N1)-methyltransferase